MNEPTSAPARAQLLVDLAAIRHNVSTLADHVRRSHDPAQPPPAMMVVVKADGYGHGMAQVARVARAAGADWLGVATLDEARALRASGDTGRVLCWLAVPGERYDDLVVADVDCTAYTPEQVTDIAEAARRTGTTARLQLKIDTGLSRGGATRDFWPSLVAAAVAAEAAGLVRVTGIWSHFACSDEPEHPANDEQELRFRDAVDIAEAAGLRPEVRHLANSAAAILRPSSYFDLVRCGIASYGLDPAPGVSPDLGLIPAMTARADLALVKRVAAGESVSYGQRWTAPEPTTLGLVPAGYADGVPRALTGRGELWSAGARRPLRGTVCMDQVVIDFGDDSAAAGQEVVLFGSGTRGEPTAQEWAERLGTISYEVVTRMGGRFTRAYVDGEITPMEGA